MFQNKLRLVLTAIWIFGLNSSNAQTGNSINGLAKIEKADIKEFDLSEGIHDVNFTLNNGEDWKVRLSIPAIIDGKKHPLILALHWAGDESAALAFSDCLAMPATDSLNSIIVIPTAGNYHWINPINEGKIIDMVKKMKKYWPVDKNRIVITGYSNGGVATWSYAERYPDLFTSAIPIAGTYTESKMKIPIYVIHGDKDELFDINVVKYMVKQSQDRWSDINLTILEGYSHYMGCRYVDELKKKLRLALGN